MKNVQMIRACHFSLTFDGKMDRITTILHTLEVQKIYFSFLKFENQNANNIKLEKVTDVFPNKEV